VSPPRIAITKNRCSPPGTEIVAGELQVWKAALSSAQAKVDPA
jgi:hypothetical protein